MGRFAFLIYPIKLAGLLLFLQKTVKSIKYAYITIMGYVLVHQT